METNPMRKVSMYKGYILECTGVPDKENPIGLYFDERCDAYHILISGSISPFLAESIAEAIIHRDSEALENILKKSGLKEPESRFSAKAEMEIFEICFNKRVQF